MSALSLKFDAAGFALALVLHASALLYVYFAPPLKQHKITTIEVDVRKPKPPPPPPPQTPPEPPKPPEPPPPEPPKKLVRKPVVPQQAPKPTTKEPPPEPPKPVFGIDPSQTGGEGISVPTGNTTIADPSKRPKVTQVPPLLAPAGNAPVGSEYHPLAEEELKRLPEHESDECGPTMKQKWTESEANANGLTGDIVLRIELDERGKVRAIKVVKSFSKEIEKIAIGFLRFDPRCRFRPAFGKDGKPAAFVIERYTVHFERE